LPKIRALTNRQAEVAASILVLVLLAACGGGGGGREPTPTSIPGPRLTSTEAEAAVRVYVAKSAKTLETTCARGDFNPNSRKWFLRCTTPFGSRSLTLTYIVNDGTGEVEGAQELQNRPGS